jgi:hypothetical protein
LLWHIWEPQPGQVTDTPHELVSVPQWPLHAERSEHTHALLTQVLGEVHWLESVHSMQVPLLEHFDVLPLQQLVLPQPVAPLPQQTPFEFDFPLGQQIPLEFEAPVGQQIPVEQLPEVHCALPEGQGPLSILAAHVVPLQYWVLFAQQLVPHAVWELVHALAHDVPLHPVDGQGFVGCVPQAPL